MTAALGRYLTLAHGALPTSIWPFKPREETVCEREKAAARFKVKYVCMALGLSGVRPLTRLREELGPQLVIVGT